MSREMPFMYRYIVIEGNIGSGKTTVATMLAERLGARLVLEQFSDNPFLPKFYAEPSRHAFPLELSFLAERYHQHREEILRQDMFAPTVIADYMLAKSLIFAKLNLSEDEFQLYRNLFSIIHGRLPRPDIIIYLHSSEERCLRQIGKRGREYEQQIGADYLLGIQDGYLDYLRQVRDTPVVIFNAESLDVVNQPGHMDFLMDILKGPLEPGLHHLSLNAQTG
jgi:deoxyguanosine kinase